MTTPSLAGVTASDDFYGNVLARNQATGVLMPEHDAAPDIILVVGQSNAAGNGYPVRPRTAPTDHLVQWWHTGQDPDKGTVTIAQEPTARAYDGSKGTSPGVEFARHWAAYYRKPTIIVPAAWGGTGLISGGGRWQETGDLNIAARREARDCIAATGGKLAAIIWCQGEQDSVVGVSDSATDGYGVTAARVLDAMRTDLGNPTALIAVGSMAPDWVGLGQGTATTIQAALAGLPSRLTRCVHAYGGAGTGSESDGIHYNAQGTRQVGTGLWQAYRRLLDPTRGPARPPAPSVAATATGVRAYLVQSPGATGYEARYRTTGDWTTIAVSGLSVAITAAADTLVEVQVRGTASGKDPSRWSASGVGLPLLATATLLVDANGAGAPHLSPVSTLPLGSGRTATQSSATNQPRQDRDTGIGDGAATVFDGRDDYLSSPTLAPTVLGSSSGTFTVAAVTQATTSHDGSFFGWRADSGNIFNVGVEAVGGFIAQGFNDSGTDAAVRAVSDVTRPHVVLADRWGAGITLTIDGTEAGSLSNLPSRTTGTAPVLIGAAYRATTSVAPLQFFNGKVGFLAVFPAPLSATQKQVLTAYLRGRFNI